MIVTYNCPECGGTIDGNLTQATPTAVCGACGASSKIPPIALGPGVVIGTGFRIVRQLRTSSVGEVFEAFQESMDRRVLLKVLPRDAAEDEDRLARFQREVKVAASLQHPNLLGAIDAGEDNGVLYLVSQYREGRTLAELIQRRGKLPEQEAVKIALHICLALAHIWDERRLVHRNVKPETILIPKEGNPMLTDLGIAKNFDLSDPSITRGDFVVGTPQYMSPEQCLNRDLDYRADMYSLGCTLYEALAGRPPFTDENPMTVMKQQVNEEPPSLAELCPELTAPTVALIHTMLAKKPEDRPLAWKQLVKDLETSHREKRRQDKTNATVTEKQPAKKKLSVGSRAGNFQRNHKKRKNRGALVAFALIVVFGLIAWGAYSYVKGQQAKQDDKEAADPGGLITTKPPLKSPTTDTATPDEDPSDESSYEYESPSDYAPSSSATTPEPEAAVETPREPPPTREQPDQPVGSDEARLRLEKTVGRVLNIMRSDSRDLAPSLIEPLLDDPEFRPWRDELRRLLSVSRDLSDSPATVLATFQDQIGQPTTVQLKTRILAGTVRAVDGTTIRLEETLPHGNVMREIAVTDLHPAETVRRLRRIPPNRRPHVAAIILAAGGEKDAALSALSEVDGWLADRLRTALDQ